MGSNYDVVIVGGSVAGASVAIALAPAGYRILLLDQATFPRDKPCGEGIMPQGVEILAEFGLLAEILAHGGTEFRGLRYRNRQGLLAQADFPPGREGRSFGIVIRRLHLDHLLFRKARSFPNVTAREGFRVTEVIQEGQAVRGVAGQPAGSPARREEFHAPLTIGADGRHSIFHAACGLTRTYLPRRRFGVTGHLRGVRGSDSYIEVLLHPQCEIYIAPCGEGLTLVALLLEERSMRSFAGDLPGRYHAFLMSAAGFRERALASELVDPVFAVGPLGFTVEPCHRPGLILVGDSAGFLDPITGEGMTLALKSVRAAVRLISEAFATGEFGAVLGRRYVEERFSLIEDVFRFTRLILKLSRHKTIADRAIRRLRADEELFQKLLGIVAGRHRYGDLSFAEKASLLLGPT
jgi:2-polyprenyl-6-methoxyphenol hydroxylase-like FAD-dependent oxidoreductase